MPPNTVYVGRPTFLMREQEKHNPDTGLVAVLCDGVRLVREHLDFARAKTMKNNKTVSVEYRDGTNELRNPGQADRIKAEEMVKKEVGTQLEYENGRWFWNGTIDVTTLVQVAVKRELLLQEKDKIFFELYEGEIIGVGKLFQAWGVDYYVGRKMVKERKTK